MTAFVHEGRRSFVVLFAVLAMIVALLAIPATPANAVATAACPATIPSAGFTDLVGFSVDVVDAANCLAFYGITKGTSATTYGPAANVSRWQMALFLTRQAVDHGVTLPSGADQGFTDLTGLSAEAVTAINQLAQLNITKGTSATTFDPNGNVGRWQMALFITRLVTGAGITLPSGADQGFTDIGGLSAETQTAINQTAQLAISKGTTATTFDPTGLVTRAQMSLFLTRTLQAGGVTPPATVAAVGVPQLVSVAFDAEDTVTEETRLAFTFDEDVAISSPGEFWLIDAFGTPWPAASATLSSSNNKVALAVFSTDEWDNATTAAVTGDGNGGASGAVRDISANYNLNGSVSVVSQSVSGLDWPDDYPELVSVAVSAADDDATFTFDQKIDVSESVAAGFVLVFKDGTTQAASAIETTTDGTAVKVTQSLTASQAANVVRGFVAANSADGDTVTASTLFNFNNVIDVTGASNTDVPELVSAAIVDATASAKQMTFKFSSQLQAPIAAAGFEAVYADGTTELSTAAVIKSGDATTVEVTFAGGMDSDLLIYAHALPAAVTAFPSGKVNAVDGAKFGPYTFAASRTAGPDLVTSAGSVAGLAGDKYNLSLTFDEDVAKTTLTSANVRLWDEDGVLVPIGAVVYLDDDGDELVVIQITAPAATISALKNGEAPLVTLDGVAGPGNAADDFGYASYPTSIGCGC